MDRGGWAGDVRWSGGGEGRGGGRTGCSTGLARL